MIKQKRIQFRIFWDPIVYGRHFLFVLTSMIFLDVTKIFFLLDLNLMRLMQRYENY